MTREEEIAEITRIRARWQAMRDFVATEVTDDSPGKAVLLAEADALIAKAQRYLAELEHPDATTPMVVPAPKALQ